MALILSEVEVQKSLRVSVPKVRGEDDLGLQTIKAALRRCIVEMRQLVTEEFIAWQEELSECQGEESKENSRW